MNKNELIKKLDMLELNDDYQKRSVICSLIGHSNIQTAFFGYVYCGRCGDQVGDALGSFYYNENQVVVGHNCDICFDNFKKTTWEDRFMTPYPFVFDVDSECRQMWE